ncbi:MAG: exonuclease SbcCD subunit D [Actinomycetaceae bacterium]|nr:exonuclease SbcCD subunit D [Actinomycetaceae bacterium]
MKFIHTADWHLGRVLHDVSLLPYQEQFLDHFVDLVKSEAPKAVLLAGDVFDWAVPSVDALRLFDDVLVRLTELTHVVVIPGNHDSASRLGFGSRLFNGRLHVICEDAAVGQPVTFSSSDGDVHIYPIPYLEPDRARRALAVQNEDGEAVWLPRSHEAVLGEAMRRINADLNQRGGSGVAMAHAFVNGSLTSDSERSISVGGAEGVGAQMLAFNPDTGAHTPLSYLACGHLHRPQTPYTDDDFQIRYSGSPLPLSFSESQDQKSSTVLQVSNGQVQVEEVAVPSFLSLRRVVGTMEQITSSVPQWAEHAYVSVEVTDPVRPAQLFNRVRQVFPHTLSIRHTGISGFAGEAPPVKRDTALQPEKQTEAFFTQALGRPLLESEQAVMREVWEALRSEVNV